MSIGLILSSHAFLTIQNSFDFNDPDGGSPLLDLNPNWKWDPLVERFSKWSSELLSKWLFCLKINALIWQHFRTTADWWGWRWVWQWKQAKKHNDQPEEGQGWLSHTAKHGRYTQAQPFSKENAYRQIYKNCIQLVSFWSLPQTTILSRFWKCLLVRERDKSPEVNLERTNSTILRLSICLRILLSRRSITFTERRSMAYWSTGLTGRLPMKFHSPSEHPGPFSRIIIPWKKAMLMLIWGWAKKEKRTAKWLLSLGKLPRYMHSNRQMTVWQVISVILLGFEIYILQMQSAADGHRPQQLASSSKANRDQLPPPGLPGPSNEPREAAEACTQQQTDSSMVSDLIHLIGPWNLFPLDAKCCWWAQTAAAVLSKRG